MRRAWYVADSQPPPVEDVQVVRCPKPACRSIDIRIRTSTRTEGGRLVATLECGTCGNTWKILGTAPVRALIVNLQTSPSQA